MSDEILRALAPEDSPRERTRAAEPGRPKRVVGFAAAIDASARWRADNALTSRRTFLARAREVVVGRHIGQNRADRRTASRAPQLAR